MKNVFNKNDLKSLFSPVPIEPTIQVELKETVPKASDEKVYTPAKFNLKVLIKFLVLFFGIFFASYFLVNAPALETKLRYFYDVSLKRGSYSAAVPAPLANIFDPTTSALLVIPKIGVRAPIIWNINSDNLSAELLQGVVHSEGTALPGQIGNVFITGHSSYYAWVNSPYKDIFALLDKLEPGDLIYIEYSANIFTYEVTSKRIVPATETSVMDQGFSYNLSLMTCVPIGTNLNRLIISSEQTAT